MNYENWENDKREKQKIDSSVIITWSIVFGVAFILLFLLVDVIIDIVKHFK